MTRIAESLPSGGNELLVGLWMMPLSSFRAHVQPAILQEKLYVELKNILGRQPGPEVAEQLEVYHENLKHKV